MLFLDFLKFITRSLDLDYEHELYMYGYYDALNICNSDVTVKDFGHPIFNKLYEILVKEGRIDDDSRQSNRN